MNISELTDQVATGNGLDEGSGQAGHRQHLQGDRRQRREGRGSGAAGFRKVQGRQPPGARGRNPATGETIKIAASKKLTFAPAKAVKDAING